MANFGETEKSLANAYHRFISTDQRVPTKSQLETEKVPTEAVPETKAVEDHAEENVPFLEHENEDINEEKRHRSGHK